MASFSSYLPLFFVSNTESQQKHILSRNLQVVMAPAHYWEEEKKLSTWKMIFDEVNRPQTAQRPSLACTGCLFPCNIKLLAPVYYITSYTDEAPRIISFNSMRLNKKHVPRLWFLSLLAPSPNKACVGLINQVHVCLTDTSIHFLPLVSNPGRSWVQIHDD